jgi:hypothetical protein
MNIEFEFPDAELNEIKGILISNLNLTENISDADLNVELNKLAKTAFYEYMSMISESGMPTKVSDILQNRILYLIEHYYMRFPNENELARIFNIQMTRSRSALNSLKATHRNKLKNKLNEQIVIFLNSGDELENDRWEFEVKSKPIIQELNDLITLKNPGLEKFKQKTGSAGKVVLPTDSYDFLKAEFGIQ